jgi:hypothetical protein
LKRLSWTQTLGLVCKERSFFGALDWFNLDVESSAGQCQSPLGFSGKYIFGSIFRPVFMVVGLFLAKPVWEFVRRQKPLAKVFAAKMAPPQLTISIFNRGLVLVFLALFAPITRSSIEILVCKMPCIECAEGLEGMDCDNNCGHSVNVVDTSIKCFTGWHMLAVLVAVISLTIYCVMIPVSLLRGVHRAKRHREKMLVLPNVDVRQLFERLDADHSHTLDSGEFRQLLVEIRKANTDALPEEADAEIARAQQSVSSLLSLTNGMTWVAFERWYVETLKARVCSSWLDVLYVTTQNRAPGFFVVFLALKTAINIVYTLKGLIVWHIWLHATLMGFGTYLILWMPFESHFDEYLMMATTLSLSCLVHVASIFETHSTDSGVILVGVVSMPVAVFAWSKVQAKKEAKLPDLNPPKVDIDKHKGVHILQLLRPPSYFFGCGKSTSTRDGGEEPHSRQRNKTIQGVFDLKDKIQRSVTVISHHLSHCVRY